MIAPVCSAGSYIACITHRAVNYPALNLWFARGDKTDHQYSQWTSTKEQWEQLMTPNLVPWLLYEPDDSGILWIKFNRPDRMNATLGTAQDRSTASKVVEYMRHGDDDPNVRVIVLTGVGRGFCAGNDAKGPKEEEDFGEFLPGNRTPRENNPDGERQSFFDGYTKIIREISLIRKPTIAMVNGPAAGSGMDMAVQCDIRVGCENSQFITYHARGQTIENGGAYFLPRIIGLGRTLEFAYTGQVDAQLAQQWGLLNHLVPSEELEGFTRELCVRIMRVSPISQWINKRIIRAALDTTLEGTMVMTSNAATIIALTEDKDEARDAQIEKRPPVFKGR
jgi:2-(1,2-epoxy-1,2-dihydrophenyl)acetyl-CoA isomerase